MAPEFSSSRSSPRAKSASAITPTTTASTDTAAPVARRRTPVAVVAPHSTITGARATAQPPARLLPAAAARMVENYGRFIWDIVDSGGIDLEIRATLACQFQKAEHKNEFLVAMGDCIKASLYVSASSMTGSPDRAAQFMANVGNQFAFYASVDARDASALPLTRWLNTIDLPFMANHPARPLWMNQAAVFSFLTYTESDRGMEPWSAVPHPDWLREKRQVLRDLIPADVARVAAEILTTTHLPPVLSEVTAQYALFREWDECLARLQGAKHVPPVLK